MKDIGDAIYRVVIVLMLWTIYLEVSGGATSIGVDIAMVVCMLVGCLTGAMAGVD